LVEDERPGKFLIPHITSTTRSTYSSKAKKTAASYVVLLLPLDLLPAAASIAWPSSPSRWATIRQQVPAAALFRGGGRGRVLFGINNNNFKMDLPIQWARALQANGGGAVCAPTDVFDDDDALRAYATIVSPVCTCVRADSFDLDKYFHENPLTTDATLID
jgi:hypothetical protein